MLEVILRGIKEGDGKMQEGSHPWAGEAGDQSGEEVGGPWAYKILQFFS